MLSLQGTGEFQLAPGACMGLLWLAKCQGISEYLWCVILEGMKCAALIFYLLSMFSTACKLATIRHCDLFPGMSFGSPMVSSTYGMSPFSHFAEMLSPLVRGVAADCTSSLVPTILLKLYLPAPYPRS